MPNISNFYGIAIKMFFRNRELPPAHIHAVYGRYSAQFDIATLEVIKGDLPARAEKLVKEWLAIHKDELQRTWDTQEFKGLPGLE